MAVFCFTISTYSYSIFAYGLIDSVTDCTQWTHTIYIICFVIAFFFFLLFIYSFCFCLWRMTSGEREFWFSCLVVVHFLCHTPRACQMYEMMVSILKWPCIKRKWRKNRMFRSVFVADIIDIYIVYIHGQWNWSGSTKWKINEICIHVRLFFFFSLIQCNIYNICIWYSTNNPHFACDASA